MKKALEIGAPFSSATITILLLPGTHYMVRYFPDDFYMPTKYDGNSQTTSIIIDSSDGNEVTVNYKLSDSFRFKVGAGLTIRNLNFNAIDSSIDLTLDNDFNNPLFYARDFNRNWCGVSPNGELTGGGSCQFWTKP